MEVMGEASGQFAVLFFAGVGMLLAGGVNLLIRRGAGWRALGTAAACAAAVAGAGAVAGTGRVVGVVAGVLAVIAAVVLFAGSGTAAVLGGAVGRAVRRPAVRAGGVLFTGLALVVGSVVGYEAADGAALDRHMTELEAEAVPPPGRPPDGIRSVTDRGTPVPVREATAPRPAGELALLEARVLQPGPVRDAVLRVAPPDDRSNCHGWVFTGGRYWVTGSRVQMILDENDYRAVPAPQVGDLVVYRQGGVVIHTALVRYLTPGQPVMVESKWGCTGVYLHASDKSVYGTDFTYYHTPRGSHLLDGLGGPSPDVARHD